MNINFTAKSINFKFNDYLSKGFELLKRDFGNIFVGMLITILMSIIPFCSLLAAGNFYKYIRKINKNQPASPGEIFDFKDFMPYFIFQLIIIGGVIVLYIPLAIIAVITGATSDGSEPNSIGMMMMLLYIFLMVIIIFYFLLKAFYIQALISFKGFTDIKTAWNASKTMTKDNLLSIFLFSMVVGILSQLGIILCGIGILVTMPLMYTTHYFAFEDAMKQIEHDEISEIGIQEKY